MKDWKYEKQKEKKQKKGEATGGRIYKDEGKGIKQKSRKKVENEGLKR